MPIIECGGITPPSPSKSETQADPTLLETSGAASVIGFCALSSLQAIASAGEAARALATEISVEGGVSPSPEMCSQMLYLGGALALTTSRTLGTLNNVNHAQGALHAGGQAAGHIALGAAGAAIAPLAAIGLTCAGAYRAWTALKACDFYTALVSDVRNLQKGPLRFLVDRLCLTEEDRKQPLEMQTKILKRKHNNFKKTLRTTTNAIQNLRLSHEQKAKKQFLTRALAVLHEYETLQGTDTPPSEKLVQDLRDLVSDMLKQSLKNAVRDAAFVGLSIVNIAGVLAAVPTGGISAAVSVGITAGYKLGEKKLIKYTMGREEVFQPRGERIFRDMNVDFNKPMRFRLEAAEPGEVSEVEPFEAEDLEAMDPPHFDDEAGLELSAVGAEFSEAQAVPGFAEV